MIDYDEKAEDAVDYEDIDEQYEGPETQAVTEEDYLLPKNDYFSAEVSTATFDRTSVFDDENYDDDDDDDGDAEKIGKEQEVVNNDAEVQTTCPSGLIWIHTVFSVFVYVNWLYLLQIQNFLFSIVAIILSFFSLLGKYLFVSAFVWT